MDSEMDYPNALSVVGEFHDGKVTLMSDIPYRGRFRVLITFIEPIDEPEDNLGDWSVSSHLRGLLRITAQEFRILELIQEGKRNYEIAEILFLMHGTVRNYVSSILRKLKARNRTEAVAKAVEIGLLR